MSAQVVAVCLGPGGIPKRTVPEAEVTVDGLVGDKQRMHFHGGRNRAVCLLSVEEVRSLEQDGVAVEGAGAFGENLLMEGAHGWELRPGDRLRIGDTVLIELHDVREPCGTLRKVDRRFPDLMIGRSGWVCRVLEEGTVCPGMTIQRESAEK